MSPSTTLPLDDEPQTSGTVTMQECLRLNFLSERAGFNPRHDYGEHDGTFAALVASVKELGVLSPPLVVQTGTDAYDIVDGHRRIAAAREAGLTEIDCQVMTWQWSEYESKAKAAYTPELLLSMALVANLQRRDLNCMEIAEGIARLEKLGKTQEQIAGLIGRDQGRVSKLVRLLTLPSNIQISLRVGELSPSHGEELLPLVGSLLLGGEIEVIALKAVQMGLTKEGLRNVVKARLAALEPKQEALPIASDASSDYAPAHNSDPSDEFEARVARTLAATKGMDKDKEPKSAPKDDNGLTRRDADASFAAAMAPDPDVIPLSERPSGDKPKGTFFFLPSDVSELLFELSGWHRQEHGGLTTADEKLSDIVRSFHQAKLEMRAEAEAARAALAVTFPVFEEPKKKATTQAFNDVIPVPVAFTGEYVGISPTYSFPPDDWNSLFYWALHYNVVPQFGESHHPNPWEGMNADAPEEEILRALYLVWGDKVVIEMGDWSATCFCQGRATRVELVHMTTDKDGKRVGGFSSQKRPWAGTMALLETIRWMIFRAEPTKEEKPKRRSRAEEPTPKGDVDLFGIAAPRGTRESLDDFAGRLV